MPLEKIEENKKETALKLIPCDRCNGYSRLISSKEEVRCSKCEGLGMYAHYFGDVLY